MKYRREIDGLRALAVVPVILFHAGFGWCGGGFVGVDIFFVISGYLITQVVIGDLQNGKFSLLSFYERRARRILPALFLVMLCCVPFAWAWMFPAELLQFAKSLVAVAVYASNILFLQESDYFAPAAEFKPLLHTWSLAVEEQFYVVFPALFFAIWHWRRRWLPAVLLLLGLASLMVAQLSATDETVMTAMAAFYLLPTRSFELLIGALAALRESRQSAAAEPAGSTRRLREAGAWIGLILIVAAIVLFDKYTPFPGLFALVPTVGTVLVIVCADRGSLVGRLLGNRALVAVGLVSYSAYLWHQPLFAFARLRSLDAPSAGLMFGLALSSLILAYFSWRFVERPFRDARRIGRRTLTVCAIAGTATMVALGLVGYSQRGFDNRTTVDGTSLSALAKRVRFNYGLGEACSRRFNDGKECRTADEPEILVWGDSYAMHLVPGILASHPGSRLVQMTKGGCAPTAGFTMFDEQSIFGRTFAKECLEFNAAVIAWLREHRTVRHVVLATPFANFTAGDPSRLLLANGKVEANKDLAVKLFVDMLDGLRDDGIEPVVFGPPPSSGRDNGRCLIKSVQRQLDLAGCDFPLSAAQQQFQRESLAVLVTIGRSHRVVELAPGICTNGLCKATVDGTFIYGVGTHLSYEGSAHLGKKMDFYALITQP